MFDIGMSQLSNEELFAELRRRFQSFIAAGLTLDGIETEMVMGGNKIVCVGLAATLQRATLDAEIA